jgi:CRISPR-associated protein Cas1
MKITVIDKKDITIKLENSSLKIGSQNIPFKLMDMLILNHRISLKTSDILNLTKNKISILIISHNNINTSLIHSSNPKGAELKLSQYNALTKRVEVAKYFLKAKIISHAKHLEYLNKEIEIEQTIKSIELAQEIDTLLGIEGTFAKKYFKEYFSLFSKEFQPKTRTKHPPLDPLNAILSYWYNLYYHIISVKLLSYGFEPTISYLHTPFRTHNALASDILEVFRAQINHAVYGIFNNSLLSMDDFAKKGGVYLKWSGRTKVWSEFVKLADVLKPQLDTEIANLRGMINKKG